MALAHIHLAYARLPPCGPDQARRLFVADELIEARVVPTVLMKAQGFDPAPLALLKANFNPAQPRRPADDGRDSGRWRSVESAAARELIARLLLEAARRAVRNLRPSEPKSPNPEVGTQAEESPEAENLQLPEVDSNKLHHIFDDPRHRLDSSVTAFDSQESAFQAVASAAREAVKAQGSTREYEIEVTVLQHLVTVTGRDNNGIVNIATVYIPWTR